MRRRTVSDRDACSGRSTIWQVKGKRVLVRADLNVPVKDGEVTDATRIERQAPDASANWRTRAREVIVLSAISTGPRARSCRPCR